MSAPAVTVTPVNDQALNDQAFYRPEVTPGPHQFKAKEPIFNAEQQKRFDRAFGKREAKLRSEYEPKLARVIGDLLDTAGLLEQLLERCGDRLSPEDVTSIRRGIEEIRSEHVRTNGRGN